LEEPRYTKAQWHSSLACVNSPKVLADDEYLRGEVARANEVAESLIDYLQRIRDILNNQTQDLDWNAECDQLIADIDFLLETPPDATWWIWWPKMAIALMRCENLLHIGFDQEKAHKMKAAALKNISLQSEHNSTGRTNNLDAAQKAFEQLTARGLAKPSGSRIAKEMNMAGITVSKRTAESYLKELRALGRID
jgi:hypothetical protein